jgi:hypothetical protein
MATEKSSSFYERFVEPAINQTWLDAGYTQEQINSGEALETELAKCKVQPYPEIAEALAFHNPKERKTELATAG